jgi:outer membrane protein OmpA-like peptidoglycan-associated protein
MQGSNHGLIGVVAIVALLSLTSCAEHPRVAKGAAAGAGIGALAGGGKGAAAGVGAISDGLVGHYLDDQTRDLEQIVAAQSAPNDRVTRAEDSIRMSLSSDTLFDTGSATIYPGARDRLVRVARSLDQYQRTNVLIVGHTDSTGSAEANQRLSEDRARAVRSVLVNAGVNPARMRIRGDGESNAVATNETVEGRTRNRRVEIVIEPNDELRHEDGRGAVRPGGTEAEG